MMEEIKGTLERILYRNEENFYSILEVKNSESGENFTACGKFPGINCGETLTLTGNWTTHPKFGKQFNAESFSFVLPADIQGIRKYLSSGLIPGIGKMYGNKIVDYFGGDTFDILSTEPERLLEVPGIGKLRAEKIQSAWNEQHAIRDILIFLQTYNIPNNLCFRIYKTYGNDAKQILLSDPYRVAREIDGIGFKTADKLAQNIGIPSNHESRIDAGIFYIFSLCEAQGSTCFARAEIVRQTQILLELSTDKIESRLSSLINFEQIVEITPGILQLYKLKQYEYSIFCHLARINRTPNSLPSIQIENAIQWTQTKEGFSFAEQQIQALRNALSHKLSILTGGPGTGKTTILRALVSILRAKNIRIGLAAPTGRAAQKLTEVTHAEAKTIHRLLQFNPQSHQFSFNSEKPLEIDFLILDESSMVDTFLAESLLQAIPSSASILLVGDKDQLPSIGPGNVFADFIASKQFRVTQLDQIFRQGKNSEISEIAHQIIHGIQNTPYSCSNLKEIDPHRDFCFIPAHSPEICVQKINELCSQILPKLFRIDPINDIQILAPLHKGEAGIENINTQLQEIFCQNGKQIPWSKYRLGDKIIQLRNNYDKNILNGDFGTIYNFDTETRSLYVQFDNECVEINRTEIGDITLAYAISIHKSQGSEFPIVIIPLLTQHYVMLQRNLLYTAITRGRHKVYIVGDLRAYSLAISNDKSTTRNTGLSLLFGNQHNDFTL